MTIQTPKSLSTEELMNLEPRVLEELEYAYWSISRKIKAVIDFKKAKEAEIDE